MDINIPPEAKGAGFGAMVTAFVFAAARVYQVWKTARILQQKYVHVTDETIRKELWTQWGMMQEELKAESERRVQMEKELVKVKAMHANCLQETGVLVGKINALKDELDRAVRKKPGNGDPP